MVTKVTEKRISKIHFEQPREPFFERGKVFPLKRNGKTLFTDPH